MDANGMNRRQFLKVSGATAAAAGTGIEGILEARRAPAWAQGVTLNMVRWADFVPASDKLLREERLPKAETALGATTKRETINADDIQPRITAAIEGGSGPDIIMTQHN